MGYLLGVFEPLGVLCGFFVVAFGFAVVSAVAKMVLFGGPHYQLDSNCPHCGHAYKVNVADVGGRIWCDKEACRKPFTLSVTQDDLQAVDRYYRWCYWSWAWLAASLLITGLAAWAIWASSSIPVHVR